MTATLNELSAPAPTGLPSADATAIAPASAAARKLKVGLENLTNRGLGWREGTNAAHLGGGLWRKQTRAVVQGGRARRSDIRQLPVVGKSWLTVRPTNGDVTAIGRTVPIPIARPRRNKQEPRAKVPVILGGYPALSPYA